MQSIIPLLLAIRATEPPDHYDICDQIRGEKADAGGDCSCPIGMPAVGWDYCLTCPFNENAIFLDDMVITHDAH